MNKLSRRLQLCLNDSSVTINRHSADFTEKMRKKFRLVDEKTLRELEAAYSKAILADHDFREKSRTRSTSLDKEHLDFLRTKLITYPSSIRHKTRTLLTLQSLLQSSITNYLAGEGTVLQNYHSYIIRSIKNISLNTLSKDDYVQPTELMNTDPVLSIYRIANLEVLSQLKIYRKEVMSVLQPNGQFRSTPKKKMQSIALILPSLELPFFSSQLTSQHLSIINAVCRGISRHENGEYVIESNCFGRMKDFIKGPPFLVDPHIHRYKVKLISAYPSLFDGALKGTHRKNAIRAMIDSISNYVSKTADFLCQTISSAVQTESKRSKHKSKPPSPFETKSSGFLFAVRDFLFGQFLEFFEKLSGTSDSQYALAVSAEWRFRKQFRGNAALTRNHSTFLTPPDSRSPEWLCEIHTFPAFLSVFDMLFFLNLTQEPYQSLNLIEQFCENVLSVASQFQQHRLNEKEKTKENLQFESPSSPSEMDTGRTQNVLPSSTQSLPLRNQCEQCEENDNADAVSLITPSPQPNALLNTTSPTNDHQSPPIAHSPIAQFHPPTPRSVTPLPPHLPSPALQSSHTTPPKRQPPIPPPPLVESSEMYGVEVSDAALLSADDFLPLLIHIFSRHVIVNPFGKIEMIQAFVPMSQMKGSMGFFFSSFQAALSFIRANGERLGRRDDSDEENAGHGEKENFADDAVSLCPSDWSDVPRAASFEGRSIVTCPDMIDDVLFDLQPNDEEIDDGI